MNRLLSWILAACILLLTINAVSALELRYTNWGGGLTPNTWTYGTTALSINGDAYKMSYYQDQTRSFGTVNGLGDNDFNYAYSASRPVYTTYHTASNSNYNYRTYDYGSWQLNYAQARSSNWGFQTQPGYGGNLWGTGYYGGYVAPLSGPSYGPTSSFSTIYPSNSHSTNSYYGTYRSTRYNYYNNQYYRTPSAHVSYGNYYY